MTEEVFKLIVDKIDEVRKDLKEDLSRIEAQTIKTNGRVSTLEDKQRQNEEQYRFAVLKWSEIARDHTEELEQKKKELEKKEEVKEKKYWFLREQAISLLIGIVCGSIVLAFLNPIVGKVVYKLGLTECYIECK